MPLRWLNVKMAGRALVCAVVLTTQATACSSIEGPASVTGEYALSAVYGAALPGTVDADLVDRLEAVVVGGGNLSFRRTVVAPGAVSGSYDAEPAVLYQDSQTLIEITGGSLTLNAAGTWSLTLSVKVTFDGTTSTEVATASGTWSPTAGGIHCVGQADGGSIEFEAALSGASRVDVMSGSLTLDEDGTWSATHVFRTTRSGTMAPELNSETTLASGSWLLFDTILEFRGDEIASPTAVLRNGVIVFMDDDGMTWRYER